MMLSVVMIASLLGAAGGWRLIFDDGEAYSSTYSLSETTGRPYDTMPVPVAVKWFLFRKGQPPKEIFFNNASDFACSGFDFKKRTCFIIHGYTQSAMEPWVNDMCQELTKHKNVNCAAVDWSAGSLAFYPQAVSIVRYVGRYVSRGLRFLEVVHKYPALRVNLIGHSLGCHIAGFAGKHHEGVGQITALDPAGVYFEGEDEAARLSKKDARFVVAIHTDAKNLLELGLGYIKPIGHVDFYPNGGRNMPECPDISLIQNTVFCLLNSLAGPLYCSESFQAKFAGCKELLKDLTLTIEQLKEKFYLGFCSHFQAVSYYTKSIAESTKYEACPCDSLEDCLQGKVKSCPEAERQYMGYHARPPSALEPTTYTLTTVGK